MQEIKLRLGEGFSKKAAVVGHERSGTHFLMNTLALNFGYFAKPWWNFDFELSLNFHSSENLFEYLKQVHDKPVINILKSHHHIDFFSDFIDYFASQFHIIYIFRDPRDVMISFRKLIQDLPWEEGPKTSSISEFIRSAPCAAIMRFQKKQEQTVLHRWQSHVNGWLKLAENNGNKIIPVRYEDLNLEFEKTVERIGESLGEMKSPPVRPDVDDNVIGSGQGKVDSYKEDMTSEDIEFVISQVGDTMKRLGYL